MSYSDQFMSDSIVIYRCVPANKEALASPP
jgi:hypothetical protein